MARTTPPRATGEPPSGYELRPYEVGDRTAVLDLYETVFGRERDERWFRWKFEANPFVDRVPIVVAERRGRLVGCRAFFPLEMRVDGRDRLAFQPCDTMVHPDHRRRGLFTAMNRLAVERYRDGGPTFYFNFPNAKSRGGNLALGWEPVGDVAMYYRPQDPVAALGELVSDDDRRESPGRAVGRRIAHVPERGARRTHRAADRLLTNPRPDLRVDRHERPPAEVLATVASRGEPAGIHAARTARFYRWRLGNPDANYRTYVASRGHSPVAAVIVSGDEGHLQLVDALPRALEAERPALEWLLEAVLEEYADRPYVTAFGDTLPRPLRYRFLPDTHPPLSTAIRPTTRTLFAKSAEEDLALEASRPTDWTLSRLDLDTT